MGRGVGILLAASLGLNFFIAGFLLHDRLDRDRPPPPFAADFRGFDNPRGLVGAAGVLPPESRREFRRAFRAQLPNMRGRFREMRTLRLELRALLEANELDAAAVAAKMTEIRDARARQQEAFDAAFAAAMETLSAEERQRMIEFSEQRRKERRNHRGGPPRPD